jgi:hypothetical protein
LGEESAAVITCIERMLDGMVRKDASLLREVLSEDMQLIHMTGHKQTREEFLGELLDGTLNYRSSRIIDAPVAIDSDTAEVELKTETEAAVYGGGYHRWRLRLDTELRLTEEGWRITRSVASTYRGMYMDITFVLKGKEYRGLLKDLPLTEEIRSVLPKALEFSRGGDREYYAVMDMSPDDKGSCATSDIRKNGIYWFPDWGALCIVIADTDISPYTVIHIGDMDDDISSVLMNGPGKVTIEARR